MMLGDFLITRGPEQAGLRKKLRRLRLNAAAGWTGTLSAADYALASVDGALPPRPTKEDVEAALKGIDVAQLLGRLVLVGWVIGRRPEAFKWDSDAPHHIHWGDPPLHVGSGGVVLDRLLGEGLRRAEGEEAQPDDALYAALWVTTNLIADEVLGQSLRALRIGHAYELLYWSGCSFEYLDDLLYLTVQVVFSDAGKVERVTLQEPSFKYLTNDEVSLVATCMPSRNEIDAHFMTPVGTPVTETIESWTQEVLSPGWTVPLRSSFYGVFVDLRAAGYVGPLLALVIRHDAQPDPPIIDSRKAGELTIRLPDGLLEWLYQEIQKNQAAT